MVLNIGTMHGWGCCANSLPNSFRVGLPNQPLLSRVSFFWAGCGTLKTSKTKTDQFEVINSPFYRENQHSRRCGVTRLSEANDYILKANASLENQAENMDGYWDQSMRHAMILWVFG